MTAKTHTLSYLADALLARVQRDPNAPHYSEDTFRRKLEEANRRESRLLGYLPTPEEIYLTQIECHEIAKLARLTSRQFEVLGKRASGMTFEEIGNSFGFSKQGAQNIYLQAIKKILFAWKEYAYSGLSDVYRMEVRRGVQPRYKGKIVK